LNQKKGDGQVPRHADYIELSPNGQVVALNVPAGQWHTVKALESGTIIMETKESFSCTLTLPITNKYLRARYYQLWK
jgi:hypothetical protein